MYLSKYLFISHIFNYTYRNIYLGIKYRLKPKYIFLRKCHFLMLPS